jgi:hypothetical protein
MQDQITGNNNHIYDQFNKNDILEARTIIRRQNNLNADS